MKNLFIYLFLIGVSCIKLQAQPATDHFTAILNKMKNAEGYSTGITIEVKDKDGNLVDRREASVKKAGDKFFYRLDDSEVILNDSLYIAIDHAMKLVQYAPKSAVQDQVSAEISQFIPESAIEEMSKRVQVIETPGGWTVTMPGQNGAYRDLTYSVGPNYELRRVTYMMQDDVSVAIVYQNFQYEVDSNDEVFMTRRILSGADSLMPAYQDYQLNNSN